MRCQWNGDSITGEECNGGTPAHPVLLCDACDNLRQRWLKVLQEEDRSRFTRKQLLNIIDTHKSLSACRQILRIMQQHRVVDDDSDEDSRPRANAPNRRNTPLSTPPPPVSSPSPSQAREAPLSAPAAIPTSSLPSSLSPSPSPSLSPSLRPSTASFSSSSPSLSSSPVRPTSASPPLRSVSPTHLHHLRRSQLAEQKKEDARAARASIRKQMAAERLASTRSREVPVPPAFTVLEEATRRPAACREMEQGAVTWDQRQKITCWKCGQETVAERDNVQPLVIGDKDHLYRALPLAGYGAVVCVPALVCSGRVQSCAVGFSRTMAALWWEGQWVALPDFMKVAGAGERCLEVPQKLCHERAVLHVLHWFSKTKEARDDDHAGFPPPGVTRGAAIVYRGGEAAGYCTFTTELVEEEEGWRLPTFYNIFVRHAFRRMGAARQLLVSFFRPQLLGKVRRRKALFPSLTHDAEGKARGTKLEEREVMVPTGLDTPGLEFLDMLHIDPPVSKALVSAMKKIFSPTELSNIVCDSGRLEAGSLTYLIDPADPKTRVFRPSAASYIRFERPRNEPLEIGGMFEGEKEKEGQGVGEGGSAASPSPPQPPLPSATVPLASAPGAQEAVTTSPLAHALATSV